MNQGTVEFENQEHADMHELGSKLRNHQRGKGNVRGIKGVTDREKQRVAELTNKYAEKLGMSPSEVQWHARDVNAASKTQAAKFQDGEHRPLKYSPPKSKSTPSATSDDTNDVRQPKNGWTKKETPQEPAPPAEEPPQAESTPEVTPEATPEPQDQTPATPVPAMPRHAKKAINDVAMEYELDPEELFQFAHAEIEGQRDYHTQRESKKSDARKATGMNAGNLAKLENSGKDASSDNASRRGFDTAATELGLEGDEDVWGLIREGKQDLPKIGDPAFLRRMAADLAHMKQNGDMSEPDPMQFYREPTTNDLGELVPFSRPRVGIERGRS